MAEDGERPIDDGADDEFDAERLYSSVIAPPLSDFIHADNDPKAAERVRTKHAQLRRRITLPYPVIIDLNVDARGGTDAAKNKVKRLEKMLTLGEREGINDAKSKLAEQQIFARFSASNLIRLVELDATEPIIEEDLLNTRVAQDPHRIAELMKLDPERAKFGEHAKQRAIYHVWLDFPLRPLISRSLTTVKADAAHRAFSALGDQIVWAVMDSGIDRNHPHFWTHKTLDVDLPLVHSDFTGGGNPLQDGFGHGTHVGGIIAGEIIAGAEIKDPGGNATTAVIRTLNAYRDETNSIRQRVDTVPAISGMAPRCKLLSLKVLDDQGNGEVSNLLTAITYIQQINGYGRKLLVQGVNMSLGYDFDPEWFACGQSPLCVEVNRLIRSGVIVVVAAGNTGYVFTKTLARGVVAAGASLTINDPGNADLAITVGSTHRDMPHVYGVSYFSSKGPTGDGRLKPDLVAPGEKILSCAAPSKVAAVVDPSPPPAGTATAWYVQDSGTSMAAPHVSGAIAAFLSIRGEFVGRPDEVKSIFVTSATDLKRERYFQGSGLVDLMRAIQSV
jgi:subtilisin family serine protease